MTRVQLSSSRCGHRFNAKGQHCGEFTQAAGDIVEVPADEAQRLLDRGLASIPQEKKG